MSHVGKHYDLLVDDQELRMVVVGQEYGQAFSRVDLEARTSMIDGSVRERRTIRRSTRMPTRRSPGPTGAR
ncbi:hypothetical protein [Candidatus Palauibacter polyketidifaciens]|uniref:hypothetical protein n=1 Tax=Candidatus Palauibacter polyketidifaciens TaxID=3056740 RepID=UPI002395816D|nr:hypothetical protein [Candidatus Palauibacter polyketidifaciens]MDE2719294.1 hypothetical protein [Candidatus Palauibacter polyketidifaciens]